MQEDELSKSYDLALEWIKEGNIEAFVDLIQNNLTLDESVALIKHYSKDYTFAIIGIDEPSDSDTSTDDACQMSSTDIWCREQKARNSLRAEQRQRNKESNCPLEEGS